MENDTDCTPQRREKKFNNSYKDHYKKIGNFIDEESRVKQILSMDFKTFITDNN